MEYRMKCNVCGKIFCYTDEDLQKNADNATLKEINAIGGLMSVLGGTILHTQYFSDQSDRCEDKIIDYSQCPHCHSRNISAYDGENTPNTAITTAKSIDSSASTEALLKRAFIFLEDGEWATADAYCEACLDRNPELAEAYLGKLMASLHVKTPEELKNAEKSFDDNANYRKIVRYANDELKNMLNDCIMQINTRNENDRKNNILQNAQSQMDRGTIAEYEDALLSLRSIAGWKNADELKKVCQAKIAELREKEKADRLERERLAEIERQKAASEAAQARINAYKKTKKRKKLSLIAAGMIAVFLLLVNFVIPSIKYSVPLGMIADGQYEEAIKTYRAMDDSKETAKRIAAAYYAYGEALLAEQKYEQASAQFENAGDYKNAAIRAKECISEREYVKVEKHLALGDKIGAYKLFMELNGYRDSSIRAEQLKEEILQDLQIQLLYFNTDPKDRTTILETIPKKGSYLHYEFKIVQNPYLAEVDLIPRNAWPEEYASYPSWCWNAVAQDGNYGCSWDDGYSRKNAGDFTIDIMIKDTQIILDTFTVKME